MPDHCHLLLRVPPPESISIIIGSFKSGVSHNIGIGRLWQTRFDLRLERPSWKTLKYIHLNPVKAGLVAKPQDYPWSSASGKWDVTAFEGL